MRRPPMGDRRGDRWLSYRAISRGVGSEGLVQLLGVPKGNQMISDIDDTIKITEIPAGTEVVLRNTFLRPDFAEVPEMAQIYRATPAKRLSIMYQVNFAALRTLSGVPNKQSMGSPLARSI